MGSTKDILVAPIDGGVARRFFNFKIAERIKGMDPEDLTAGQIPAALKTLFELEFKALGYEDRVALTGKDGGPVKVEVNPRRETSPQGQWAERHQQSAEPTRHCLHQP